MNVDLLTESVRTIEQARSGDQVGMALIEGVRRSAEEGSPRAQATAIIMESYINKHPVDEFGEEIVLPRELLERVRIPETSLSAIRSLTPMPRGRDTAEVVLVDGPPLTRPRVGAMARALGQFERQAFFRGFVYPKLRPRVTIHLEFESWRDVGRCVARARALQGFLRGIIPLSAACPSLAWELGERVRPEDEDDSEREFRRLLFPRSRPGLVPFQSGGRAYR